MIALAVLALLLGVLLILVEAHAPTAGVLSGVSALLIAAGVWLLFVAGGAETVALPVAIGTGAVGLGLTAVAGRKALAARRAPVRGGAQSLVGRGATVTSWSGSQGQVHADGGLWRARIEFGYDTDPAPAAGETVVVSAVRGLTLAVRRPEPWEEPL
ncbi:NfeD family protein [Rhodococcus kronopolitis]|uniref:NfeD family protein n=1 Tax=Rhodococcus kronopolitis TaxID=1460226 RepID=A0ABV9FYH6_9NOCA